MSWRVWLVGALLGVSIFGLAPPVAAQDGSPAFDLAQRFAPIAYLRVQEEECDRGGEGYFPAPVDFVLDNPEVVLKERIEGGSAATDPIIKRGPTAQDLAGLDEDYYLDFPGNPRRVGCTFERDFRRMTQATGAQPTAYARIVLEQVEVDEDDEDEDDGLRLILQYWFWYYFNDWNNTHEGDWEMIQLVFHAGSAEEALQQEAPAFVGYAQHGGGELADWDDDKLGRSGDRLHVFPAAGSHATHFEQRHYIGWGPNGTGFGCDNTSAPSQRTELDIVLIPDEITPDGEFAWLLFGGRWGERQPWEFNGPRGPNGSSRWADPVAATENWRSFSLYVPASQTLGPTAAGAFCSWSGVGSQVLIFFGVNPELLLVLVLTVLALVAFVMIRRAGEIRTAFGLYLRHFRTFLLLGLLTIPIGIVFNIVTLIASEYPPMEWVVQWFNDTAGARLLAAMSIGGLQQASMILIVAPPVIQAVKEIRAGRSPNALACIRDSYRNHIGSLTIGVLLVYATIGILALVVIGLPLAIWLAVRWQFFGQAIVLDDKSKPHEAIRTSGKVTARHWWRVLTETFAFQIIAVAPGPLIGLALMMLGRTTVQFANSLSSIVYAVAVPVAVIGLTLAYERFRDRHIAEAAAEAVAASP